VRPADANETAVAWRTILERGEPAGLVLTRQAVPTLDRNTYADVEGVARGAYILADSDGQPEVLLLATGSEVSVALAAADTLREQGVAARVVSMPCLEWFDSQEADYRESVLPAAVTARVSVEAGASGGWWKYLGTNGRAVGIDHFGASADGALLLENFGITADAVVAAAQESVAAAG
jgi:transketolase